jgi:hypothetical protein
VLEQTTRDSENGREWGGLQEKAQRKTRMTKDKVMDPRESRTDRVMKQVSRTNQNTQNSEK